MLACMRVCRYATYVSRLRVAHEHLCIVISYKQNEMNE